MKHSLSLGVKGFFISQAKREVKHTHTYTPKYTYAHPHTPVQTEAVSEQCIETTWLMGHYFPGPDSELEKGKLDERLVYAMFMLSYAIRDLIHLVLALDEKPAKNIQMRKHSVNWKAKYNKE